MDIARTEWEFLKPNIVLGEYVGLLGPEFCHRNQPNVSSYLHAQ
jgi:hypothetical protein